MRARINKLRKESLNAPIEISEERALLMTFFYLENKDAKLSTPVMRAKSLAYYLQHKKIGILPQELIVGERGPKPKSCPTYPEICLHSIKDLLQLHQRDKVSYHIDLSCLKAYEEIIIPFWKNNSNRDRIFQAMTPEWTSAYEAGIFTEFQEQRAPGHTVLGDKLFRKGFLDIIEEIKKAQALLELENSSPTKEKTEALASMAISAQAIIDFAHRHAAHLTELAQQETDQPRKLELEQMAEICLRVPAHAPQTFHEALQHYWFIHLGVVSELNPWDSFSPGRLDQHLWPFYQQEIEQGTLDLDQAKELLQAFWIKFNNHPAPPKMGVTAQESSTYTDFSLINIGGLDANGKDASNELSYIILDVIQEMRLLQPSSMVQISKRTPNRLIKRALDILETGSGQPSIFNIDGIITQLLRQGKSIVDARNGGASGCVESGAFGTEAYVLTGYFNLPKILELSLHQGKDPISGKQLGPKSMALKEMKNMADLKKSFQIQIQHFIDIKIHGNNTIDQLFAHFLPAPFLSLLIDDCIKTATDYNQGGARYNSSYIQGVGLASITDALTAIKHHVFDQKNLTLEELVELADKDFIDAEEWQYRLITSTPKYGNDDDYADDQAQFVFQSFFDAVDGRPNTKGGHFRVNMLPTTCHIYFGSKLGGSCDGRSAFEPLSEGISPVQACDTQGPAAVIRSASKFDHLLTGGTLLNQKWSPDFFKKDSNKENIMHLIRTYFKLDGHHIQFNVVDVDCLRAAQREPEKYRDLIVRVAGYSDYFNDLGEDLQNEIIRRTEYAANN